MVTPLRDDCSERFSTLRLKWAKFYGGGWSLLVKSLRRQLEERAEPDWNDLWPNEEERRIAIRSSKTFKEYFGMPNAHLIPEDPMELIVAFDGDGGVIALQELEDEYRLALNGKEQSVIEGVDRPVKTFGDFVRYIRDHQGTLTRKELYERHKVGFGCAVFLWLIFVIIIGLTVRELIFAYRALHGADLGVRQGLGLIFGFGVSGIAIMVAYLFVSAWWKNRREIKQEARRRRGELTGWMKKVAADDVLGRDLQDAAL